MKTIVLSPFTINPDEHSDSHGFQSDEPSLTVQSDLEASDINNIVRQYGITGEVPHGVAVPIYDDFTDIPNDYHAAQNFILASNETFMEMPAQQRARFDNDPGKFLDFVYQPQNYNEAIELGFIPPTEPPSVPTDGLPTPKTGSKPIDEPAA